MKQLKLLSFFLTLLFITPTYGQGVYICDKNSAYAKKHEANSISYLNPSKDGIELELVMRDGSVIPLPKQSTSCLFFYKKDITIDEFSISNITDSSVEFKISYSGLNKIQNRFLVISKSHIDKSTLPNTLLYFGEKDNIVNIENLESSTTYYAVCAIVNSLSNDTLFSKELCFNTKRAIRGSIDGHGYVDLGLPSGTLWASCNVGAISPEQTGDYYAWGEIQTKDYYGLNNYKWCKGSSSTMTKYCTSRSYGTLDNKTILDDVDDVVCVKWGGKWRLPTSTDIDELINNCNWKWTTMATVEGYMIVSKFNNQSIFLPITELPTPSISILRGNYWTSSLDIQYPYNAYGIYFDSSNHKRGTFNRWGRGCVRAVYK